MCVSFFSLWFSFVVLVAIVYLGNRLCSNHSSLPILVLTFSLIQYLSPNFSSYACECLPFQLSKLPPFGSFVASLVVLCVHICLSDKDLKDQILWVLVCLPDKNWTDWIPRLLVSLPDKHLKDWTVSPFVHDMKYWEKTCAMIIW